MPTRTNWTRSQLLIALNLYHKVSFGMFHAKNKMLVEISERMGRKPSALPMKLSNLASIDPEFRKTGRKGLDGASEFDRAMWAEYHANLNELAPESEALLAELMTGDAEAPIEVQPDGRVLRAPEGPTESTASVTVRRGQRYFRQAVLNAYQGRCALTGIGVRDLLVASHIIPWSKSEEHRLDPQNDRPERAPRQSLRPRPHHLRYRTAAGVCSFLARPLHQQYRGPTLQGL